MVQRDEVRVGYFADFKSDNTVLFWGSSEGLVALAALLRALSARGEAEIRLTDEPWMRAVHEIRITIEISDSGRGIHRIAAGARNDFSWSLTPASARDFAAAIEALADSTHPAHQYLDSDDKDQCVVMVSMDEYDDLQP